MEWTHSYPLSRCRRESLLHQLQSMVPKNAAIFAAEILAVSDEQLRARLWEERKKAHDAVIEKDAAVSARFN